MEYLYAWLLIVVFISLMIYGAFKVKVLPKGEYVAVDNHRTSPVRFQLSKEEYEEREMLIGLRRNKTRWVSEEE